MELQKKRNVVGQIAWFCPAGTTIGTDTVSSSFRPLKPTELLDNGFVRLGCIETFEPTPNITSETIQCFEPGAGYVDADEITTTKELTFNLTTNQMSALVVDLLFFGKIIQPNAAAASPITYTPGSGDGKLKGWLHVPQYFGTEAAAFNELLVWVSLQINGAVSFGNAVPRPAFTGRLLRSSLNTGTLTGLGWSGVPVVA